MGSDRWLTSLETDKHSGPAFETRSTSWPESSAHVAGTAVYALEQHTPAVAAPVVGMSGCSREHISGPYHFDRQSRLRQADERGF